jgi:hypothetical protein
MPHRSPRARLLALGLLLGALVLSTLGDAALDGRRCEAAPAARAQRTRPHHRRRPKPAPAPAEPAAAAPDVDAGGTDGKPDGTPSADPKPAPALDAKGGGADGAGAAPSPSPSGAASESTTPALAPSAELVDVDALRQEYLQLRDELFRSRARASTLSSQLYSTKVTIRFTFTSGRYYGVTKATVRLDGASVFDDGEGAIANDDAVRFEGYVAPGRHLLTFRLETTGKDDNRFTSSNEAQVALQAVAGKDLVVAAKAKDGGDIAYAWKRSEKGSYGLGIDISVKTQRRDAAKRAAAKAVDKTMARTSSGASTIAAQGAER